MTEQEIANLVENAYIGLLHMSYKDWPRHTSQGQKILCNLRDALAALQNRYEEDVQNDCESRAIYEGAK